MEEQELISTYRRYIHRKRLFIIIFFICALCAVGLELSMGPYNIGFFESFQIAFDHIKGVVPETPLDRTKDFVIWDIRLPRAIAGLAVGAGLGVCGAAMQSALKNPLADPYTTGISSGASLGVAVAMILGTSALPMFSGDTMIIVNAFIFSLIPAAFIIFISVFKKTTSTSMILIGVAVMYIFSATTSLLMLYAEPEQLADVYIWSVGTLAKSNWDNLAYIVAGGALGVALLWTISKRLNILSLKDESISALGVNAKNTRISTLVIVSLTTAVLVCFTGTIGFVGLVAPHMVRIFIGSDNRYLIPASASFGAVLLLLADVLAKQLGPAGLPVGVITAVIGGPLFLIILMKQKKSAWD